MMKVKVGQTIRRSKSKKLGLVVAIDRKSNRIKIKNENGVLEWIDEAIEKVSWIVRLLAKIRGLFK